MSHARATRDPEAMNSKSHNRSPLVEEVRDLEQIAKTGGSSKTPLILLADAWVVSALAVVVMLALALLAYRLA